MGRATGEMFGGLVMNEPTVAPSAEERRLAFVQAGWHADLLDTCRTAFIEEIGSFGVAPDAIDVIPVPGSFEIPLMAKQLALTGRYRAVVAAGLVVDGGIYRHEFVADAVINGLMRVQLDTDVPVISVVLTPHQFREYRPHVEFFAHHLAEKGAEAARACAHTLENMTQLTGVLAS
jgi:6,7-dimethyl-8-ribityllumazine synthase